MPSLTKLTALLTCGMIMVTGCATTQKLTPMQKRQITTRVIDAPYEEVFRATLTVIQDEGYNIKKTDMETGLITGDIEKTLSPGLKAAAKLADKLTDFGAGKKETTIEEGWDYQVNCLITAVSDSMSELRVTIHKVTHSTTTTSNSDAAQVKREPETIYDQKVYQNLFNKIKVEVQRRQTLQQ